MKTKELQELIADNLKAWQRLENHAVAGTGKVLETTDNRVVRLIMEIIQHDSTLHYRVQEMIVDSLESKPISLTPEELAGVWSLIEEHIAMEKKAVDFATAALEAIRGKQMVVQEYLLNYLLLDENKHDRLLEQLDTIKKGMYPYGG